ncbi:hypothetical protein [Marimonas lutisalis]|uniref:hypothetical protein n=1 Tax=Marimonas lutisalis TaxID=2545756 RepID=UPI0010F9ED98|nr:hypothetical protein [Marimonas lutisalis]
MNSRKEKKVKAAEAPEMQHYLDLIRTSENCAMLLHAEEQALRKIEKNTDGIDWADFAGTEVLQDYWLVASSEHRQAELGRICHLRALAWNAIFGGADALSGVPFLTPRQDIGGSS